MAIPAPPLRMTDKQLDQTDEILSEIRGQLTRLSAGLHASHVSTIAESLAACRAGLAKIETIVSES